MTTKREERMSNQNTVYCQHCLFQSQDGAYARTRTYTYVNLAYTILYKCGPSVDGTDYTTLASFI